MSLLQLFRTPAGSPTSVKKEGKFKKFRRNFHKSTNDLKCEPTFMRQRSVSTSALHHLDIPSGDHSMLSKRNSVISMTPSVMTNSANSDDDSMADTPEPSKQQPSNNQISVKELIEKMITHLQVLERKNDILTQNIQKLMDEKINVETDLSSTKVELNLCKNRLNQIETMADEWLCGLCSDNKIKILSKKRYFVSTLCGHIFCSTCVHKIIKYCPTCHKPVKDGKLDYHRIHV